MGPLDKAIYQVVDSSHTRFFFYKNHVYKNVEAHKWSFLKDIVVILLVAISISFEPQFEI